MLNADQIQMLTVDEILGRPQRVLGDEADLYLQELRLDIQRAKASGQVLEIPKEIEVGNDEPLTNAWSEQARAAALAKRRAKAAPKEQPQALQPKVLSEKAAKAKAYFNPGDKPKQDESERFEHLVASILGFTKSGNNKPMDVTRKIDGQLHGIELKVLHSGVQNQIYMRAAALGRKKNWAKKNKAVTHTIVIDNRDKFDGGKHASKFSGHNVYYKEGVGSFSLSSMTKAKSLTALKNLLTRKAK